MHLTSEQLAIINTSGNIKINAVAGSGKTTTIIEYAQTRPKSSRILYLAFNKAVKLEAEKKFAAKELYNVKVETAHSLAYKNIVYRGKYTVSKNGYKVHEIAQILGLRGTGEKLTEYIMGNHINKFAAYFCNSDKQKVQDLNYLDVVKDAQAKAFVKMYYDYIERQTREFLSKMDKGEIEIIHDFYLKKFQLSNPSLQYDYILFDEGQDASPAMLDIFLNQKAIKVIVGDTNQQIYGWRYAINSLEKVDYATYHLTKSFRFPQSIADLAVSVLEWKNHVEARDKVAITGEGNFNKIKSKAVLARTNLGLLLSAIKNVTDNPKLKYIYFEGNINSYTYADEGASLYDVLNLYNGKIYMIKDPIIKTMSGLDELEEYINKTEDAQLSMMVEIVKEYGNEIPGILKSIKDKHVGDGEKDKAQLVFSTVHRCKGMEYDQVELADDFLTEEKLEKLVKDLKEDDPLRNKLNEEINLLYVGITRARKDLYIPFSLLPKKLSPSANITVIDTPELEPEEEKDLWLETVPSKYKNDQPKFKAYPKEKSLNKDVKKPKVNFRRDAKSRSYSQDTVRENYKDAYRPWTPKHDLELKVMFRNGVKVSELAQHFERTSGAIMARIKKLDL